MFDRLSPADWMPQAEVLYPELRARNAKDHYPIAWLDQQDAATRDLAQRIRTVQVERNMKGFYALPQTPRALAMQLALNAAMERKCETCPHYSLDYGGILFIMLPVLWAGCEQCAAAKTAEFVLNDDGCCDVCSARSTWFQDIAVQCGSQCYMANMCAPCAAWAKGLAVAA